jgi:hypothetical protein
VRLAAITSLLVVALAGIAGAHPGHSNTALSIVVRDGAGGVKRAKLYCLERGSSARGFLRGKRVHRLCERADQLATFLTTPPDPDRMCTQEYGGPQTARIRGSIDARPVDRPFHRRDGCGMADWRRARMLLGGEPPPGPASGGSDPRDHHCRGWCHPEPLLPGF